MASRMSLGLMHVVSTAETGRGGEKINRQIAAIAQNYIEA